MSKKKEGRVTQDRLKAPYNGPYPFHRSQTCTCMAEMDQSTLVLEDSFQLYLCMCRRSTGLDKLVTV